MRFGSRTNTGTWPSRPKDTGPCVMRTPWSIDSEERKRGIGEALLKHVAAQARAEGVVCTTPLTDMQNERAQARYRRAGFVGCR